MGSEEEARCFRMLSSCSTGVGAATLSHKLPGVARARERGEGSESCQALFYWNQNRLGRWHLFTLHILQEQVPSGRQPTVSPHPELP